MGREFNIEDLEDLDDVIVDKNKVNQIRKEMEKASAGEKIPFKCITCGKEVKPKLIYNYFYPSQSRVYSGFNNRVPTCKNCLNNLYENFLNHFGGDKKKVIKRICQMYDIYYSDSVYDIVINSSATVNSSLIEVYMRRINMEEYKGKTYLDSIDEGVDDSITSMVHELNKNIMSQEVLDRWGLGHTKEEYMILEQHYNLLKKNNPNIDNNQELFVESLCKLNLFQVKAMKSESPDVFTKINSEYIKTFKEAGLRTVEEKDESNNATLGVTLETISKFTPEEFYKDKKKFSDADNVGEMIDRFLRRPLANLIFGTDERDKEYKVSDKVGDTNE